MRAIPAVLIAILGCTTTSRSPAPGLAAIERRAFGSLPSGESIDRFTLNNTHGIEVLVINYGGIITSIKTRDRSGQLADIVLGYDNLAGYLKSSPYFGAIVGRYANRIANGHFTLDGKTYTLAINNGPNNLHGGLRGFDKVVWNAQPFQSRDDEGVVLEYTSPDGKEGYPGTLHTRVTYTLTADDRLIVDYEATTDKATPINLSQHTYWNLVGNASRDVLGHVLTIDANAITPVDSTLIPTGEIAPVDGTPFDFRSPTAIGARIEQRQNTQIRYGNGYDHNWVLTRSNAAPGQLAHAAHLEEPQSGRTVDIYTTEPGLQFYSGNFLDGSIIGTGGAIYRFRYGLCLETQHYPDSPNHPNFPSTILRPGQDYRSRTVYQFGVH